MTRVAAVLVALWAGSLCTVCGIVAPTLFSMLDDRQQAGRLAARLFHIEAWLGLAIAVVLLGILAARKVITRDRPSVWLIVTAAAAPMISELVLGPMMDSARAANDMGRFGMLHGVSAALFLLACVTTLALVWRLSSSLNRPAG